MKTLLIALSCLLLGLEAVSDLSTVEQCYEHDCFNAEIATCKNADNYFGIKSTTKTGKTCQHWDAAEPQKPTSKYVNLPENYCRSPDSKFGAWCYTTDPATRWDYCFPTCTKSTTNHGFKLNPSDEETVKVLKQFLMPSVDPCNDLAGYSCKKYYIPEKDQTCKLGKLPNEYRASKRVRSKRQATVWEDKVIKKIFRHAKKAMFDDPNNRKYPQGTQKIAIMFFGHLNHVQFSKEEMAQSKFILPKYSIFYLLTYSVLESLDGYAENVDRVKALVPLIKQEMIDLLQQLPGNITAKKVALAKRLIRETKLDMINFKEVSKYLLNATRYMDPRRGDTKQQLEAKFKQMIYSMSEEEKSHFNAIYYQASKTFWNGEIGFEGARRYKKEGKIVIDCSNCKAKVIFGGTSLAPPAFVPNVSYAFVLGNSLPLLFHEFGHIFEYILQRVFQDIGERYKKCFVNMLDSNSRAINCPDNLDATYYTEAAADSIGLTLASNLYKKSFKHLDTEVLQVGNSTLNREQILFIGYGITRCQKDAHIRAKYYNSKDYNSNPKWKYIQGKGRVNFAALGTSKAFLETFKCKKDLFQNACRYEEWSRL